MTRSPCLQETYLSQELPHDEDGKHDRAHHRHYVNNLLPSQTQPEPSRIKRLLKKSLSYKQTVLEHDNPPELSMKTASTAFPDLALLDDPGFLNDQHHGQQSSSTYFPLVQAPDQTRPGMWSNVECHEFSMGNMMSEAANGTQAVTEELSSGTHVESAFPVSYSSSSPDLTAALGREERGSTPRKLQLSFSKNVAKYYRPSSKAATPTTPSAQLATFPSSPCSHALDHVTSSIGPASPPAHSLRKVAQVFRHSKKSNLESHQSDVSGKVTLSNDSWLTSLSSEQESNFFRYPYGTQLNRNQSPTTRQTQEWFTNIHGEKYHPHPRSEVPYWMSYRPEVMNHHILMLYASSLMEGCSPFQLHFTSSDESKDAKGISTSNISSNFQTRKVLDIGCGPTAMWCIGTLREAEKVEVVGIDMCPLLLETDSLENSISKKFRFLQHDFLDSNLPFEAASFDYVHASFISPGIPEEKWTFLLEEMARVLKPQGTLEFLESDQLIADSLNTTIADPKECARQRAIKMWQFPRTGSAIVPSTSSMVVSEAPTESTLKPHLRTVKNMINQLLAQHYISSFPVSLLPSEISNISTGMLRPLHQKFIRFPSDLEQFFETQVKSRDIPLVASRDSADLTALEATADNARVGMVLLHSHIDSLYSNKEITWRELWLPELEIPEEYPLASQPSSSIRTSAQSKSLKLVAPFSRPQMIRQNKHNSPTRKTKHAKNNRRGPQASDEKHGGSSPGSNSIKASASPTSLQGAILTSRSDSQSNSGASNSTLGVVQDNSTLDLCLEREQAQIETDTLARPSRVPGPQLRAHRKKFDQVWNKWRDELNHHSLGITKLLEIRFGWTCTLDIENHKALSEHYETAQRELKECEYKINELRKRLLDLKTKQSFELTESPFEDLNSDSEERFHCWGIAPHAQEKHVFGNEGNLAWNTTVTCSYTEKNLATHAIRDDGRRRHDTNQAPISHETGWITNNDTPVPCQYKTVPGGGDLDGQLVEELDPNADDRGQRNMLKEKTPKCSVLHKRVSSANTSELSFISKPGSERSINDCGRTEIESHNFSTDEDLIPTQYLNDSQEDQVEKRNKMKLKPYSDLDAEIDELIQKKAEIKKSLQLIQTDLDNVKKRLGISDSGDQRLSSVTTAEENRLEKEPATKGVDNGTFHDLFSSFSRFEIPGFVSDDQGGPTFSPHQNQDWNNIQEIEKGRLGTGHLLNLDHRSSLAKSHMTINNKSNPLDVKFPDAGFGDLRIGKFYSFKGKGY